MELRLKPEYLEWGFGGGKTLKRKLKNIDPSEFENIYNLGYTEFFEVIEKKPIMKKNELKLDLEEKNEDLNDTDK